MRNTQHLILAERFIRVTENTKVTWVHLNADMCDENELHYRQWGPPLLWRHRTTVSPARALAVGNVIKHGTMQYRCFPCPAWFCFGVESVPSPCRITDPVTCRWLWCSTRSYEPNLLKDPIEPIHKAFAEHRTVWIYINIYINIFEY